MYNSDIGNKPRPRKGKSFKFREMKQESEVCYDSQRNSEREKETEKLRERDLQKREKEEYPEQPIALLVMLFLNRKQPGSNPSSKPALIYRKQHFLTQERNMTYFNLLKPARPSNFVKLYLASRVHQMTLWRFPLPKNKNMKTETVR